MLFFITFITHPSEIHHYIILPVSPVNENLRKKLKMDDNDQLLVMNCTILDFGCSHLLKPRNTYSREEKPSSVSESEGSDPEEL